MVWRRRKFWFLEALKIVHRRLKVDTIIRISIHDHNQNLHGNRILKLSIPLMDQLC